MTITQEPSRRSEFLAGVKDTFPLVVGAAPFGLIFGAASVTSGLSPAGALSMSLFVFAGSAQFIASGLVASQASIVVIVLTTFVVNLRHALYSATLAPHMKHLPQRWLAPLAFWLTDESFVVVIAHYNKPTEARYKHWYFLGSAVFMYTNWNLCTLVGLIAGRSIPDASKWGLDFAMVVTFMGMVIPMIKNRPVLISVVVAGVTAVLAHGLPNNLGILIAALFGVASGVIAENYDPIPVPDAKTPSQVPADSIALKPEAN